VSRNGSVVGSVELHGGRFVAVYISGATIGNFATLHERARRWQRGANAPMLP
jgi:hypothetical protein